MPAASRSASCCSERIFAPLGMRRSRGAIIGADRAAYAQGYEAADSTIPYARGVPLAPAAWVDVTFGAGNVASTADDMNLFIRALAEMAQGRGGLGLTAPQALEFTRHAVKSDSPAMTYGNGLMHVANAGRKYLHHTGGMVSFTSAFHLDPASGIGAFASSTLSAFSSYRPRLLTRFAVDALAEAAAGRPVPTPPALQTPLPNAAAYAGRYSGPGGSFEIRAWPGAPARRQRPVRRAPALGGRPVPDDPSGLSRLHPQVRSRRRQDHRRQLGAAFLRQGRIRLGPAPSPIRRWRGWPGATSTTARGGESPSSSSGAAGYGSAPNRR